MQQLNKVSTLETAALMRGTRIPSYAINVNLQHPCCKLTCEFYKNMIFVKRRCFFIKLPSVAVLYELDVQYRQGWRWL